MLFNGLPVEGFENDHSVWISGTGHGKRSYMNEEIRRLEQRIGLMNDQEIEQAIQAKGLTAPRVTPERLEAVITGEQYYVFPGTQLTLENGFNVSGTSAPASPANFDEALGRQIARADAVHKVWKLEGYLLRQRLYEDNYDVPSGCSI